VLDFIPTDWFTWEWIAGLGIVGIIGVGGAVWYFTGSLRLAGAAMATAGLAVLYAIARRKGQEEGRERERRLNEKAAQKRAKGRKEIAENVTEVSDDDLVDRARRWRPRP
jgi:membrane protein implicated in regulation of membrane protease activity